MNSSKIYFALRHSNDHDFVEFQGSVECVQVLSNKIRHKLSINLFKGDQVVLFGEQGQLLTLGDNVRQNTLVTVERLNFRISRNYCRSCWYYMTSRKTTCCGQMICDACDACFDQKAKCFYGNSNLCKQKYTSFQVPKNQSKVLGHPSSLLLSQQEVSWSCSDYIPDWVLPTISESSIKVEDSPPATEKGHESDNSDLCKSQEIGQTQKMNIEPKIHQYIQQQIVSYQQLSRYLFLTQNDQNPSRNWTKNTKERSRSTSKRRQLYQNRLPLRRNHQD